MSDVRRAAPALEVRGLDVYYGHSHALQGVDLTLESGDFIPIEERAASEVTEVRGVPIAPEGIRVANPAFDVTPHRYVVAIITERGVARAPFAESLRRITGLPSPSVPA